MTVKNIQILREGKSEVSTAFDPDYREVLIRKGPDAIDSTICLSVDEAELMIESIQNQIAYIDHTEKRKPLNTVVLNSSRGKIQ